MAGRQGASKVKASLERYKISKVLSSVCFVQDLGIQHRGKTHI